LISEDSDLVVEVIQRQLAACSAIQVVGRARNGEEALELQKAYSPHVVLVDLLMPGRAGLSVIHELAQRSTVIVLSDTSPDSPLARESLAQGATKFLSKTAIGGSGGDTLLCDSILETSSPRPARDALLVVAGSTGAVPIVEKIIHAVKEAPCRIVLLQHFPAERGGALADWLSSLGMPARLARAGDRLQAGQVLVAGGDRHVALDFKRHPQGTIRLLNSDPVRGHRPAASILLDTVAPVGKKATVVILSGMGDDGASAIPNLVKSGVTCLAQSPADSAVSSMPQAAITASRQVRALPVYKLIPAIVRRVTRA